MRLALTGCSRCYVTMGSCSNSSVLLCDNGSCSNSSVQLQKEDIEHLRCKLSRLKRAMTMCSCSNSSVQLHKEDIHPLRCKLSRLKRAGFVFKQLCSAPERGHRTHEMQIEQAEESRRPLRHWL